jgi:membrane-bound ClpP family serine protease
MPDPDQKNRRSNRPPRIDLLRRVLQIPLSAAVLVYFLFEDLFQGALKPVFRVLGRLSPFVALGQWLKRLNPYAALVIFAIPFIIVEPIKVFSLFWIGLGHFVSGTLLLVASYVISLLIVERLFNATSAQLLSIPWFRWSYEQVMRLKAWALEQLEATWIWRRTQRGVRAVRDAARSGVAWVRQRLSRA